MALFVTDRCVVRFPEKKFSQKVGITQNLVTYNYVRSAFLFSVLIFGFASPISAGVNPDGSYAQKIQIEAIAGVNGLTPQVELVYNSNGGNGPIGVGWSLSFPTISRAANRAIHYDATDFFVGPSGRLTLVNGEYQPQNQDWSRYLPQGQAGGAPASWIVKTNDGKTMYFGDTSDSFVEGQNPDGSAINGGARVWALSKVVDQWGQTIEYSYEKHGGQLYLKQIKYAKGNNLGRYNAISLKYADSRPDIETTFFGGRVYTQYRLSEIAVTSGILDVWPLNAFTGDMVKRYIFSFDQSPASGRSRMTGLQIRSATQILAETLFTYNGSYVDTTALQTPIGIGGRLGTGDVQVGDFTGDGLADLVAFTGVEGIWCITSGSLDGFNGQNCMNVLRKENPDVGDFNGDGRADLIGYTTVSNIYCMVLGVPSGLAGLGCMPATGGRLIADFNGDGRDDMAWIDESGYGHVSNGDAAGLSGPEYLDAIMDPYEAYDPDTNQPLWQRPPPRGIMDPPPMFEFSAPKYQYWAKTGDFNGDGFADLASWTTVSDIWCIAYGSPSGLQKQRCMRHGVGSSDFLVADFNNDGFSDVAAYAGSGYWCVSHSNGTGFRAQICMSALAVGASVIRLGDYNGDGKIDMAAYTGNAGYWCIAYGNGYGVNPQVCMSILATGDVRAGDFNGDGYTDLTAYTGVNGIWVIARGQGYLDADRLTAITANTGARETVAYTSSRQSPEMYNLSDTNPYQRANSGLYYVVREIANESNMDLDDNGQLDQKRVTYAFRGAKVIATGPISERTNLGFASMTVTDEVTHHYTVTQFRQDKPFVGMMAQQIDYDQSGNKVTEVLPAIVTQYQCTILRCSVSGAADLTVGRRMLSSGRNYTINYEAGVEVSRKYEAVLSYDIFGNATAVEQGIESYLQRKQSFKTIQYINNTDPANFAIGLPYSERACLSSPNCLTGDSDFLAEARSYYDTQPLGGVGSRHAVTKKEAYSAGVWVVETFAYDGNGNMYNNTDAQGIRTEITYDDVRRQFPHYVYRSHGGKQTYRVFEYDLRFGKVRYAVESESGNYEYTTFDDAGFVKEIEAKNDSVTLEKRLLTTRSIMPSQLGQTPAHILAVASPKRNAHANTRTHLDEFTAKSFLSLSTVPTSRWQSSIDSILVGAKRGSAGHSTQHSPAVLEQRRPVQRHLLANGIPKSMML